MPNATTAPTTAADPTVAELAPEFDLTLAAQNKAEATRKVYGTAVAQFCDFLVERGMPRGVTAVSREHIEAWIAHLLDTRSASTAKTRYGGLQVFWNWCVEEGEVARSPMEKMSVPAVPEKPVPVLSETDLERLFQVTKGTAFADYRDHAMIRLFADSGMRLGEMAGLGLDDLDFDLCVARVLGKGRRHRSAPFGPETAKALRKYVRVRARHRDATANHLWLGKLGPLGDAGIKQMLDRRGEQAGIDGLHAHRFRHTFAHRWLADGGAEGDLMRLAGWRKREMLDRYGASVAEERALEQYRLMQDKRRGRRQ